PQFCFISEFWTKLTMPREYAGFEGVGAFAEAMRARGFTDRELEIMFKENPAKALGVAATTASLGRGSSRVSERILRAWNRHGGACASQPRREGCALLIEIAGTRPAMMQ